MAGRDPVPVLKPPATKSRPLAVLPDPPLAPPDPLTCGGCRHWFRLRVAAGHGECRCHPPAHVISPGPVVAYGRTPADFPACGDYAPRG